MKHRYYVKAKDGVVVPVLSGAKMDKYYLVRTEREQYASSWMYKFVGPDDEYTMFCDEHGEEIEL
jgi:hypothetical protein